MHVLKIFHVIYVHISNVSNDDDSDSIQILSLHTHIDLFFKF